MAHFLCTLHPLHLKGYAMKKNLTLPYSIHQFAYWAASAGIISFATAFLLEKGFPASQVGLLMACANILSGVTQPLLASLADRARTCILSPMMISLCSVSTAAFTLLLLDALPASLFGALYLLGVWSFDSMIPLMNSTSVYYNSFGYYINYGVARGVGSLAYSLAALSLGYVIRLLGPNWMLGCILVLLPICILTILSYPKIPESVIATQPKAQYTTADTSSVPEFFLRYRWYCASLLGILLLAMFHSMTENYLIAIMGRLGGDSRHVGIALFIATAVEALVLFGFNQIRARISDHWLIRIAAFSFLLKSVLFLLAPSIPFLYAVQLLQMTSYSFLSPVQIYYASEKVAPSDMVKGQAFITASYTLGCAMGNLAGGQLMQHYGVSAILIAGVIIASLGTLILLFTIERKDTCSLPYPTLS